MSTISQEQAQRMVAWMKDNQALYPAVPPVATTLEMAQRKIRDAILAELEPPTLAEELHGLLTNPQGSHWDADIRAAVSDAIPKLREHEALKERVERAAEPLRKELAHYCGKAKCGHEIHQSMRAFLAILDAEQTDD